MSIFKTFKNIFDIEEVSENYDEVPYEENKNKRVTGKQDRGSSIESKTNIVIDDNIPDPIEMKIKNQRPTLAKTIRPSFSNQNVFKMVVIEPKEFDVTLRLVDNLKNNKAVVINLENVETELAKKIFDFLSGAVYALAGNVQKITNNVFIFCPQTVTIKNSVTHSGFTQ